MDFQQLSDLLNLPYFTASLVLFYILPHCLLKNWANTPRLPHLSNLSHSLPAKALLIADEFDKFLQIRSCVRFWTYLTYIIWHLFTLFISFFYVLFSKDFTDAYRDMRVSPGLHGLDEGNQSYFRIF